MFITITTITRQLSHSWAQLTQSTYFLIVFYSYPPNYAWVIQVVSFLQVFSPKSVCIALLPHLCHMPRPSHPPLFNHLNNTWCKAHTMKLHIMQFIPSLPYFLPVGPNIFPSFLFCKPSAYIHSLMCETSFRTHIITFDPVPANGVACDSVCVRQVREDVSIFSSGIFGMRLIVDAKLGDLISLK